MKLVCPALPGSVQFSLVAQSCSTLCDPMDRSTPDLPVHHQRPEFTQTHVHWVGDAIQPLILLSASSHYQVGIQNNGISYDFFICTNGFFAPIPPICKKRLSAVHIIHLKLILRSLELVIWSKSLSSDYCYLQQRTMEIFCYCSCSDPRVPGSSVAIFVSCYYW